MEREHSKQGTKSSTRRDEMSDSLNSPRGRAYSFRRVFGDHSTTDKTAHRGAVLGDGSQNPISGAAPCGGLGTLPQKLECGRPQAGPAQEAVGAVPRQGGTAQQEGSAQGHPGAAAAKQIPWCHEQDCHHLLRRGVRGETRPR